MIRLGKLIFTVIFAFSTLGSAFAIENEGPPVDRSDIGQDSIETFYSDAIYYDADEGCATLLSEPEIDEENNEPVEFDPIIFDFEDNGKVMPESFTVHSGFKSYKNKTFTWEYSLEYDGPDIAPKATVTLTLQANYGNGSGSYKGVATATQIYNNPSQYGKQYTFTSIAKTGYYKMKAEIEQEDIPLIETNSSAKVLLNRTGHEWEFRFTDEGKTLTKPRADWEKGQDYPREPDTAKKYYDKYEEMHGKRLDSSKYDVHHMQPLAYGGSNDYSNLIHLPKDLHKQVTSWFAGY